MKHLLQCKRSNAAKLYIRKSDSILVVNIHQRLHTIYFGFFSSRVYYFISFYLYIHHSYIKMHFNKSKLFKSRTTFYDGHTASSCVICSYIYPQYKTVGTQMPEEFQVHKTCVKSCIIVVG